MAPVEACRGHGCGHAGLRVLESGFLSELWPHDHKALGCGLVLI